MENYIIYPKQLRRYSFPIEKNKCFFLMPFNHDFDIVYGTIKKYLNEKGILCNRADEISGSTPIIAKILTQIIKSQYIIVDITDSNPNVYYELGIAHTLKEARNVLLIKRKDYKVPFDITHLTYIEYDSSNLLLLISAIGEFIEKSQVRNSLYDALNFRNLIPYSDDNNNDFIEFIQQSIPDKIPILSAALLGEAKDFAPEEINKMIESFGRLIRDSKTIEDENVLSKIIDVVLEVIVIVPQTSFIRDYISCLFNDYFELYNFSDFSINQYKTKLAIKLVENNVYTDIALPWIIDYFSHSKSTTIDLNRYSLESLLMTSSSKPLNEAIIYSLCNPNCYIREHMSDIIGEKKLSDAAPLLYVQLENESNFFTAQSMIEAIGKIGEPEGIHVIESWVRNHKEEILRTNQIFVLKHVGFAISKLDTTNNRSHISNFYNEFGDIIKDYYIV